MIVDQDLEDLRKAVTLLESPSFFIQMQDFIGGPIAKGIEKLPVDWRSDVEKIVLISLEKAMEAALFSMLSDQQQPSSDKTHLSLVAVSGFAGGFHGIGGIAVELPITTVFMLRSILDVARSEGENIKSTDTILASMQVFSLGSSKNTTDDNADKGYFASRTTTHEMIGKMSGYIVANKVGDKVYDVMPKVLQDFIKKLPTNLEKMFLRKYLRKLFLLWVVWLGLVSMLSL